MHALYRFYDDTGRLLYVGITADPGQRFRQHQSDKPWWADVRRITLEPLPTREDALDAERRAITAEVPMFNLSRPRLKERDADHVKPCRVLTLAGEVVIDVRSKMLTRDTAERTVAALLTHPGSTPVRIEVPFDEAARAPHWVGVAAMTNDVRMRPGGVYAVCDRRLWIDPSSAFEERLNHSFLMPLRMAK